MYKKDFYEINYEQNSYCYIGEKVKVNVILHKQNGDVVKPEFLSINKDILEVDNDGYVTGLKEGVGTIKCSCMGTTNIQYFEFYVTVLNKNISDEIKLILDNHHSNCLVVPHLGIGAGIPEYYMDIVGSVSNLMFNDRLVKNNRYQDIQNHNELNHSELMDRVEFVTIHYTGNMRRTAWGNNNAHYFVSNDRVSIHYVTGTDSSFNYIAWECLDEKYKGHHASDLLQGECTWIKTGIKVKDNNIKPIISVKDGYFTINGEMTTYAIPKRDDGIEVLGPTFEFEGKTCNTINKMGIAYRIVDGYYELDKTWWGHQTYGKALCNVGGNHNSIGIEVCVDKGVDIYQNYQMTSWLVADILKRNKLGLERVFGHHGFSAKNCPQPLLENDLQLWNEFMKQVKAHYDLINKYPNTNINFTPINNFEIVKGVNIHRGMTGRLSQDENPHCLLGLYKIGNKQIILSTAINSNLLDNSEYEIPTIQKLGIELD